MDDLKITKALIKMLEANLQSKKQEVEGFSQPTMDRTREYEQRKFQVEVEYWYLAGILTNIKSLVEGLTGETSGTGEDK